MDSGCHKLLENIWMVCRVWNIVMWRNVQFRCVLCGSVGSGGSVWVMGEWSVGQWIVGVKSLQKMYGLYGLKSIYIGIHAHVTDAGRRNEQTNKRQVNIELYDDGDE